MIFSNLAGSQHAAPVAAGHEGPAAHHRDLRVQLPGDPRTVRIPLTHFNLNLLPNLTDYEV